MLCQCSEEVAGDEYGERNLRSWLSYVMAMLASSIALMVAMTKVVQQHLVVLDYAVAKLSCRAAEPWQQVTPPQQLQITFTVNLSVMYRN